MKKVVFITGCLVFLLSCKKEENRTCFKSTGDHVTVDFPLDSFLEMYLWQNLSYHLVPDTANFVRVTGGENLVRHLGYYYAGNTLHLANENKCNFLRSYDTKIHVEIHYKQLQRIEYIGSDSLTNQLPVSGEYFNLFVNKGSGSVRLNINTTYSNASVVEGVGDYTFTGTVGYAHFQVHDNGYADVSGLKVTGALEITSSSQGIIQCNADNIPLKVTIEGPGDVWCYGTPSELEVIKSGDGNLVFK